MAEMSEMERMFRETPKFVARQAMEALWDFDRSNATDETFSFASDVGAFQKEFAILFSERITELEQYRYNVLENDE